MSDWSRDPWVLVAASRTVIEQLVSYYRSSNGMEDPVCFWCGEPVKSVKVRHDWGGCDWVDKCDHRRRTGLRLRAWNLRHETVAAHRADGAVSDCAQAGDWFAGVEMTREEIESVLEVLRMGDDYYFEDQVNELASLFPEHGDVLSAYLPVYAPPNPNAKRMTAKDFTDLVRSAFPAAETENVMMAKAPMADWSKKAK